MNAGSGVLDGGIVRDGSWGGDDDSGGDDGGDDR